MKDRQCDFIRRDVIQGSKLQLEDCVSDISPSKEPVMYFLLVGNEGRRNWIELLVCLYLIYRHGNEALYFPLLLLVSVSSLSCNPVMYLIPFNISLDSVIHCLGCMCNGKKCPVAYGWPFCPGRYRCMHCQSCRPWLRPRKEHCFTIMGQGTSFDTSANRRFSLSVPISFFLSTSYYTMKPMYEVKLNNCLQYINLRGFISSRA